MVINNNAAPAVAAAKSGDEQVPFDGFSTTLSDSDSSTVRRKNQFRIEKVLLRGSDIARPIRDLVELTGLTPRMVTKAVQDARRRGVAVISSSNPGGFFLAENEDERQRCLRSLRHRKQELAWTEFCLERATLEVVSDGQEQTQGNR